MDIDSRFLSADDINYMLNSEYRHIDFAFYLSQESHCNLFSFFKYILDGRRIKRQSSELLVPERFIYMRVNDL